MHEDFKKIKKEDVTEHVLQKALRNIRSNPRYIAENLYVFEWESDMLLQTRAGYWYEYECKISFADFKNDFSKFSKHDFLESGEYWNYRRIFRTKNEEDAKTHLLSPFNHVVKEGNQWLVYGRVGKKDWAKRPNYFSYCIPWFLEDKIAPLIPKYAGLVVFRENGFADEVKVPPILHKEKYTDEQLKLCEKFYYNWRNRITFIEQNDQRELISRLRDEISFLKEECKAAACNVVK